MTRDRFDGAWEREDPGPYLTHEAWDAARFHAEFRDAALAVVDAWANLQAVTCEPLTRYPDLFARLSALADVAAKARGT